MSLEVEPSVNLVLSDDVGLRADGAASLLGKSARERTAPNKFKRGVILVGARYEGCSVIDSDCSSLGWTSECAKLERES